MLSRYNTCSTKASSASITTVTNRGVVLQLIWARYHLRNNTIIWNTFYITVGINHPQCTILLSPMEPLLSIHHLVYLWSVIMMQSTEQKWSDRLVGAENNYEMKCRQMNSNQTLWFTVFIKNIIKTQSVDTNVKEQSYLLTLACQL